MSKNIITALRTAIKNMSNLPAAPVFNGEAIRKSFIDAGLPETFADRAVEESARKHASIHGDSEAVALRALVDSLSEGDVDLATLKRVLTVATREDVKPPSAFDKPACEKAYGQRVGGNGVAPLPLSKIAEELGTNYQNLSLAMKKHLGDDVLDRAKAEIDAKAAA